MSQTTTRGLEDVIAGTSAITDVRGQEGKLFYRGIDIGELARHSTFEETTYLLWYGKLPAKEQLQQFSSELHSLMPISGEIIDLLRSFPKTALPMDALRTAVSALAMYDPEVQVMTPEANHRKAMKLLAKTPTIVAAFNSLRNGQQPRAPKGDRSIAADFLYMLTGKEPPPIQERALDMLLILQADHELNASTFAARVTAATLADFYAAITTAIGTLSGPLHGRANQDVMHMLEEIGEPERAEQYVHDALQAKRKIPGLGHRVYKTKDPRAIELEKLSQELTQQSGESKLFKISQIVERTGKEAKGLNTNVDFYAATVYHALGIPTDTFTSIFAISRMAGWTAHVLEQYADNRLIRPRAEYTGPNDVPYVPLEQRG